MLHVILKPPFDELGLPNQCAHFEIGQSTQGINIDLVESVWADGAELIEIIKHFEGVPKRFNRFNTDPTMKWFGPDAQFIVANWT